MHNTTLHAWKIARNTSLTRWNFLHPIRCALWLHMLHGMDYILFCVFHVWWVWTWRVKCMYEIRWRRKAQRCIRDYICYACFSLSLFFIVKQLLLWMNTITYVRHIINSHIWCSAWIDNEIEKMWDEMWKRRRKNEMRIFLVAFFFHGLNFIFHWKAFLCACTATICGTKRSWNNQIVVYIESSSTPDNNTVCIDYTKGNQFIELLSITDVYWLLGGAVEKSGFIDAISIWIGCLCDLTRPIYGCCTNTTKFVLVCTSCTS